MLLELIHIWIHTSSRRRSHRTASHSSRRLSRSCVIDWVILQILWHWFACVQASFNLRVSDITTYNDCAIQTQTRTNWILSQNGAHVFHRLIQVNTNRIAFACVTQLCRNETARIIIHLLNPYTFLIDFALDITVSRATYAQTNRTTCAVTRQTDNTYVMRHIFSAELCAKTYFISLLQQLFLQFDIAESTTGSITGCRQTVIVMRRSQFNCQQVLLGTRTTNNDSDMIRRTCGCSKTLHFLYEERNQCARILDARFCLLVEIGLVGTSATFGYAQETILISFSRFQVYLCRQVALRIHLVVHVQRSILAIAQIALRIGIIYTFAQCLFVTEASPDFLPFLAMNNSCSCILAERQLSFCSHFCIAQERQRHVFIVIRSFRVTQNLSYLLVVATTKHETHVMKRLLRHQRQTFRLNFQNLVSFEITNGHIVFSQQIILCFILAELEHRLILIVLHSLQ